MNKNQRGFNIVEIVMGVVIIGLLGLVGYLFYSNIQTNNNQSAITKTTEQDTTRGEDTASPTPEPNIADEAKTETKTFNGGYGVNWVTFDYPADWKVALDAEADDIAGPSIIIKSPEYKVVRLTQSEGPSGNYILLGTTRAYNASLSKYKKDQGSANPLGSWGHFTFEGKKATIFRATTAQDTKSPPVPTINDMYKGESTWIQGSNVIYTFYASRGSSAGSGDSKHLGSAQELYDAIKTVLDSWQWK